MSPRFRAPGSLTGLVPVLAFSLAAAQVTLFEAISEHLEPSTVTLQQTSFNFPGSYLRNDTAAYSVEASIVPQFTLFQARLGGPLPGAYRLNLVPKFVVRRADGVGSNPVRTPSYIPSATLFYSPQDSLPATASPAYWYLSLGISHYSNGQTGPFYQPDGTTLNNVDGSFSLWSAIAAVHVRNNWPWLPAYKAVQIEYFHHKEGGLDALYPDYALSLKLQTNDYAGLAGRSRVMADLGWNLTNGSGRPNALKPAPVSAAVTGAYSPRWGRSTGDVFPTVSIFGRFYAGFDYYNMNFDREIYRLDAGLLFGVR